MDFIERLFGISPDGGDGSTELLYFGVAIIIIALVAWRPVSSRLLRRWRTPEN
jgi:hypothetical protein